MGLFDKLKTSVGIGGAKIEVKLDPGPVPLGGFARGKVILKGGKSEQKSNAVHVQLKRNKIVRVEVDGKKQDQTQTDVLTEENLAPYEITIQPDSERWFEFALQVPNEGGEEQRISYEVYATCDIPGMIDPSSTVKVPLTKAQEMTAANIPQLLELAEQLRNQGNKDAELEGVLKQVLGFDNKNTRALKMIAQTLDYNNGAEAASYWKQYLDLVPADVDAWVSFASNAERRGSFEEGLRHSSRAVELAPGRTDVWLNRANILEQMQKWTDAVAAYDRALGGDHPYTRIHVQKANALIKSEQKSAAAGVLLEAGKAGDQYCLSEILEALEGLGQDQHEEVLIAAAVKENADSYYPWQTKAERLLKRNNGQGAITAVETALSKDVSSDWARSQLWFLKGKAFETLSKPADAKLAYNKAIEEYNDHREAKDRLKAIR